MTTSHKKTYSTYVFEFSEEELKVLANVFHRVQMGMAGPANIASGINREIVKYIYVNEFDRKGRENWIEMVHPPEEEGDFGPALYWY